jgi:hypothetical protein
MAVWSAIIPLSLATHTTSIPLRIDLDRGSPHTELVRVGRYPRTGRQALYIHVELAVFAQPSCRAIEEATGYGL